MADIANYGLAQFAATQPNVAEIAKGGYELKKLSEASDAANSQAADMSTLKTAMSQNDTSTQEGQQSLMQSINGKVNPNLQMEVQGKFAKQEADKLQMKSNMQKLSLGDLELQANRSSAENEIANDMMNYEKQIKSDPNTTPEIKQQMLNTKWTEMRDSLVAKGLATPESLKAIPSVFDQGASDFAHLHAEKSNTFIEHAKAELAAKKEAAAELDRVTQRVETARHDKATEAGVAAGHVLTAAETETRTVMGADGKPHDVMYNKRTGAKVSDLGEVIPKGAAGSGGALAQKYASNVLSALEDVKSASENVGNMPLTSGQMFKLDPVTHIMSAPEEYLKGKVTTDTAQAYDTFITAVGVGVAQLKDPSYKPNASSIDHIQKVYAIPPGTSNQNAMIKLAHLRQDAENGWEMAKISPNMSKEQKALAEETMVKIRKAIPYTVKEVQDVQYEGQERATETGAKYTGTNKGEPVKTGVKPFTDDAKEARYQEWKKAHPNE
jgi:hypothetical protein